MLWAWQRKKTLTELLYETVTLLLSEYWAKMRKKETVSMSISRLTVTHTSINIFYRKVIYMNRFTMTNFIVRCLNNGTCVRFCVCECRKAALKATQEHLSHTSPAPSLTYTLHENTYCLCDETLYFGIWTPADLSWLTNTNSRDTERAAHAHPNDR